MAVYREMVMDTGAEGIISVPHFLKRQRVADDRELRSVNPVGMSFIARFIIYFPGIVLQHPVPELIPEHLIDFGEPADADQDHADARVPLDAAVQVLKETVLVPQPGQGVDMSLQAVVPDRTGKIVRLAGGIADHGAAAGAYVIFPGHALGPVLHVMAGGVAGEDVVDAPVIGLPVFRMNPVFPDISRAVHIF